MRFKIELSTEGSKFGINDETTSDLCRSKSRVFSVHLNNNVTAAIIYVHGYTSWPCVSNASQIDCENGLCTV